MNSRINTYNKAYKNKIYNNLTFTLPLCSTAAASAEATARQPIDLPKISLISHKNDFYFEGPLPRVAD